MSFFEFILGLPFRKTPTERSKKFNLKKETIHLRSSNEGYFKGVLKFLASFNKDPTTLEYLQQQQNVYEKNPASKSPSFISHHFLHKILNSVREHMFNTIARIIQDQCNGKFALEIDTATDNSLKQQCSVVARYVTPDLVIHNHIIIFLSVTQTQGQKLFEFVRNRLSDLGLDMKNVIASCTDGANNMFGSNKGFTGFLEKLNPNHISIWCVCHRVNLVIEDALNCCKDIKDIILLVNDFNSFIRASAKRVNIWSDIVKELGKKYRDLDKRLRPRQTNTTRWWSKLKLLDQTCKTVSRTLVFLLSLIDIHTLIFTHKTMKCTKNQEEFLEEMYNNWSNDMKKIALLHATRSILHRIHITSTSTLPISEVMPVIMSCHKYLQSHYIDESNILTDLIENSWDFAESVFDEIKIDPGK